VIWVRRFGGLFLLPVLLVAIAATRHDVTPWAIVNVLVFPLLALASIAVHELGHVIAGRLFGLRVPRVEVGVSKRIARWKIGGTTLVLSSLPVVGKTFISADHARGLKWRVWATIAAGPVVTASIVVIGLSLGDGAWWEDVFPTRAVAGGLALRELLVFFNLIALALNLFPLRPGGLDTDGAQLCKIPFMEARALRELTSIAAALEADDLREAKDYDAAERVLREATVRFPASFVLRNSLAIVLLEREDYGAARALFLALLDEQPPSPVIEAVLRSNVAWSDFMLRHDELKQEADELSRSVNRSAFGGAPWAMATRGAVLAWLGRPAEAVPLLERAYAMNGAPNDRALNACVLSACCARSGDIDAARTWLDDARKNDARCPLLGEAEAALARAEGAIPTAAA
jgi:tetratricopeptide (TPR) repeat protein